MNERHELFSRRLRLCAHGLGAIVVAVAAGAAHAQPFGAGFPTGPTTGRPIQGENFLMPTDTAYMPGTVAWASWSSVSYDPGNAQFGVVHGGGFEQIGTGPMAGSNAGAPTAATGSITVGVDVGALHAGASSSALADSASSWYNSADAQSIAAVGDFLTLGSSATVTFTGSIDGSLAYGGGGGASVDFEIAAVDPTSVFDDPEEGTQRSTWGGFVIRAGASGTTGPVSGTQAFSFDVTLPAGTTFIVESLVADAVSPGARVGPDTSADALFGNTAHLSLLIPAGVQASTSGGLLVLSAVPEPGGAALFGCGLAALAWLARRKAAA